MKKFDEIKVQMRLILIKTISIFIILICTNCDLDLFNGPDYVDMKVSGQVIDSLTQSPVLGAKVVLKANYNIYEIVTYEEAFTNESGSYYLRAECPTGRNPLSFSLIVTKSGYKPGTLGDDSRCVCKKKRQVFNFELINN
jgi:hypothetical protein